MAVEGLLNPRRIHPTHGVANVGMARLAVCLELPERLNDLGKPVREFA